MINSELLLDRLGLENLDSESALQFADTTQSTIKQIRKNYDVEFNDILKKLKSLLYYQNLKNKYLKKLLSTSKLRLVLILTY